MKIKIKKKSYISQIGNVLLIQLKRFEKNTDAPGIKKIKDYFPFSTELNIKEWTKDFGICEDEGKNNFNEEFTEIKAKIKENSLDEENYKYELTGILIHVGNSPEDGHYYSLIMDQETKKWFKFDDESVTEFDSEYLPSESFGNVFGEDDSDLGIGCAYLLIYTKTNINETKNYLENIKINDGILEETNNLCFHLLKK